MCCNCLTETKVRYPVRGTAQSVFFVTTWQNCLFQLQFDFSRKHLASLQLLCEDYSFTYQPRSIARYSFILLSELKQRGVNEITETETTARIFLLDPCVSSGKRNTAAPANIIEWNKYSISRYIRTVLQHAAPPVDNATCIN